MEQFESYKPLEAERYEHGKILSVLDRWKHELIQRDPVAFQQKIYELAKKIERQYPFDAKKPEEKHTNYLLWDLLAGGRSIDKESVHPYFDFPDPEYSVVGFFLQEYQKLQEERQGIMPQQSEKPTAVEPEEDESEIA